MSDNHQPHDLLDFNFALGEGAYEYECECQHERPLLQVLQVAVRVRGALSSPTTTTSTTSSSRTLAGLTASTAAAAAAARHEEDCMTRNRNSRIPLLQKSRRHLVLFQSMFLLLLLVVHVSILQLQLQPCRAFTTTTTTNTRTKKKWGLSSPPLQPINNPLQSSPSSIWMTFAATQDDTATSSATTTSAASTSKPSASAAAAADVVELPFMEYYTPSPASQKKQGVPVLFLHGLLGNKRNFASLAKSLGAQLDVPRRLLGVDLRNHGDNPPEAWQNDMSYTSMAHDVLHFLQQHNLDQVIVVAHSMGGKVGQTMALLQPNVVAGLVVLDMAPVVYGQDEPQWKAVTTIIETLCQIDTTTTVTTKQQVDKSLQRHIPDPALRAFCMTNWNAKTKTWSIPMSKIAHQLPVLAGFVDFLPNDDKKQYHGDVFFIHGGQSKFLRHAHMETIQGFFPNHMLTTIRGAGHWVHAEAPDDTIALLKRYLDR